MKRMMVAATLVTALLAPIAASAADNANAIVSPNAPLEIVDKTTGKILGELVLDATEAQTIAALAERAREERQAGAMDAQPRNPKTPLEWSQFWSEVLPVNVGP